MSCSVSKGTAICTEKSTVTNDMLYFLNNRICGDVMKMKIKRYAAGTALASLGLAPSFHATAESSGFTLTPAVNYIDFDSDRGFLGNSALDEEVFASIGLGYKFSNPWQLELVYGQGEADRDTGNNEVDFKTLHLDALYHFGEQDRVTPYLVVGAGHVDYDGADEGTFDKESNLNAGAGIKFGLSDMFALRTDLRAYRDFEFENVDYVASLGLQVFFGGESSAKKAAADVPVVDIDGDGDGDGVSDSNDSCPQTPKGIEVASNGCALDSDGDGVPNHKDNCPDTEAGARVDEAGCYVMLKETKTFKLNVAFPSNADQLPAEYHNQVGDLAGFLREFPNTNVVIEGHTDSSGPFDYNQDLSERRASSVAKLLVNKFGVSSSRVSSVGYGEARPIADNTTKAGKAANRRVIAVISAEVERRAE